MKDMSLGIGLIPVWKDKIRNTGQPLVVSHGPFSSQFVPALQVFELHPQHRGLQRIQPAVVPFAGMDILSLLALVSQDRYRFSNVRIVRDHGPSISVTAEIFTGVKAKATRVTPGSCPSAVPGAAI